MPKEDEIKLFLDNFTEDSYEHSSNSAMIIPMPRETYDTYVESLRTVIDDYGISETNVWTLQVFPGAEFEDPGIIEEYDMKLKYRITEGHFGDFSEFSSVEIEKVCVSTNTFSEDEYYRARSLFFFCSIFYFKRNFEMVRRYLESLDVSVFSWVLFLAEHFRTAGADPIVADYFDEFDRMTREELFDSPEEIIEIWKTPSENSEAAGKRMIEEGRIGLNVIQVCLGNLATVYGEVVDYACDATQEFLRSRDLEFGEELDDVFRATRHLRLSQVDEEALELVIEEDFQFDVLSWMEDGFSRPLKEYGRDQSVKIAFSLDDDSKSKLRDVIKSLRPDDLMSRSKFYYRVFPNLYNRKLSRQRGISDGLAAVHTAGD